MGFSHVKRFEEMKLKNTKLSWEDRWERICRM